MTKLLNITKILTLVKMTITARPFILGVPNLIPTMCWEFFEVFINCTKFIRLHNTPGIQHTFDK